MEILRINPASVTILCDCGEQVRTETKAFNPGHLKEFNEYENLHLDECPACGAMHVLNMNIPLSEYDEEELEAEPFMDEREKNNREKVREIMFKFRPDLKGRDRAAIAREKRQKIENKFGLDIETVKQQQQRVKRLMTGQE